jgi:hypothetical protein
MRKNLALACAALIATLPSLAFAQTTDMSTQKMAPASSVPSAQQDKTPAAGTSSYEGRSSATVPQADPAKPDVDGLHPSGEKLDTMKK